MMIVFMFILFMLTAAIPVAYFQFYGDFFEE
jgi:hypothetical protein